MGDTSRTWNDGLERHAEVGNLLGKWAARSRPEWEGQRSVAATLLVQEVVAIRHRPSDHGHDPHLTAALELYTAECHRNRAGLWEVLDDLDGLAWAAPWCRPVLDRLRVAVLVVRTWDELSYGGDGHRCREPLTTTMTVDYLLGRLDELYALPASSRKGWALVTVGYLGDVDRLITRASRWLQTGPVVESVLRPRTMALVSPAGFALLSSRAERLPLRIVELWEAVRPFGEERATLEVTIHDLPPAVGGCDRLIGDFRRSGR